MKLPEPAVILDRLTPHGLFARLNIASKMLMGYIALVALTVIVVVYALASLQRLNGLNESIIKVDIPVQEAANNMLEAILAQDTYEKRYLILKGKNMRNLFWKRGQEFQYWLSALKDLPDQSGLTIKKIDNLHRQYSDLFYKESRLVRMGKIDEAKAVSTGELRIKWERLLEALKSMSVYAKASQDDKMKKISRIGGAAFFTTAFLCILSILMGAAIGMVVTHHISSSIQKLRIATEQVAEGNFDYDPKINTDDEIGRLSAAFLDMGRRLKKLEEMYLDASPLTRLPGGIAIENVLKKRLGSGQQIAFCVLDIDNFKAFNDRYGYANGSEVIKEAARIIEDAVKAKGSPDDFIGHIGGDDFVIITTPGCMREVSGEIISRFDQRMPQFYDERDRKAGYILGKSRQGIEMQFPIMTISIAIVTNEQRPLINSLQASEIAAELKDYAKTIPRSVYVVDKRRTT